MRWPSDAAQLEALQQELAVLRPDTWSWTPGVAVGGCFVCFGRGGSGPGAGGDAGWAAAVTMQGGRLLATAGVEGQAGSAYRSGLLALREGPMLEAALRALRHWPEVLLVNATGRDHPRRAGLATHLGWVLDLPTVGITHRPLLATGPLPSPDTGSTSPLEIANEQVGWWLRTAPTARPVAVSPGWRTDLATAREVVRAMAGRTRTPAPIREARRRARTHRARSE